MHFSIHNDVTHQHRPDLPSNKVVPKAASPISSHAEALAIINAATAKSQPTTSEFRIGFVPNPVSKTSPPAKDLSIFRGSGNRTSVTLVNTSFDEQVNATAPPYRNVRGGGVTIGGTQGREGTGKGNQPQISASQARRMLAQAQSVAKAKDDADPDIARAASPSADILMHHSWADAGWEVPPDAIMSQRAQEKTAVPVVYTEFEVATGPLGVEFIDNSDTGYLRIVLILPGCAVDEASGGLVKADDELIAINGTDIRGVGHTNIGAVIQSCLAKGPMLIEFRALRGRRTGVVGKEGVAGVPGTIADVSVTRTAGAYGGDVEFVPIATPSAPTTAPATVPKLMRSLSLPQAPTAPSARGGARQGADAGFWGGLVHASNGNGNGGGGSGGGDGGCGGADDPLSDSDRVAAIFGSYTVTIVKAAARCPPPSLPLDVCAVATNPSLFLECSHWHGGLFVFQTRLGVARGCLWIPCVLLVWNQHTGDPITSFLGVHSHYSFHFLPLCH
jgi:hypothetical protein